MLHTLNANAQYYAVNLHQHSNKTALSRSKLMLVSVTLSTCCIFTVFQKTQRQTCCGTWLCTI